MLLRPFQTNGNVQLSGRTLIAMRLHCFFTVNSSVNAAGDHLAGGSFMEKQ